MRDIVFLKTLIINTLSSTTSVKPNHISIPTGSTTINMAVSHPPMSDAEIISSLESIILRSKLAQDKVGLQGTRAFSRDSSLSAKDIRRMIACLWIFPYGRDTLLAVAERITDDSWLKRFTVKFSRSKQCISTVIAI
jgi:hypothetical protein